MINFRKNSGNELVYFHHWRRKNFAVFNSLNKVIKICALTISYTIILLPNLLNAQQSDTNIVYEKEADIDEVVVTGSRTPDVYSEIARIVTVITKSEIEQAPVQSIADLLEYAVNVDIKQRGLFGVQTDINIRGGTFDQVLVLLNGVNIADPQTGHYSLDLPLDINSIERIEVLNGPAARIYGANAFNGAINIITTGKKDNSINSSISVGDYGFYKLLGSGSYNIKGVNSFISLSRMSSDGYTDNTFFDISSIFLQSELPKENSNFYIQSGISIKEFGANYLPAFPVENEKTKPVFINAGFSKRGRFSINGNIYYKQHNDHFQFLYDTTYFNYYHLNNTKGGNFNFSFQTTFFKSTIGIDYRNEGILSTTLGNELNDAIVKKDISYTHNFSRNISGLFYELEANINNLSLSGGLMVNLIDSNNFNIYPGIDASYKINNNISIFSSLNKTLRLPTFTDILYKSPDTYGNRNLLPEKAVTGEFGIKYNNEFINMKSSVFARNADEIIDWVQIPIDSIFKVKNNIITNFDTIWHAENISDLKTVGSDFSLNINVNRIVDKKFFIQNIKFYYCYLDISKDLNQYISKYALDNLKHNASLFVKFKITDHLFFNSKLSYFNREGTITLNGKQLQYKPVTLVDGRLFFMFKLYSIYLEASNILNKQYFELGNQIQPGIWIRGGITMSKILSK